MKPALDQTALERILCALEAEPAVMRAILFGSRAKGTNRPGSDIDLCIEGTDIDEGILTRLETGLDDLLLPWEIDLVPRANIADPELLAHIERVGIPLFTRKGLVPDAHPPG